MSSRPAARTQSPWSVQLVLDRWRGRGVLPAAVRRLCGQHSDASESLLPLVASLPNGCARMPAIAHVEGPKGAGGLLRLLVTSRRSHELEA